MPSPVLSHQNWEVDFATFKALLRACAKQKDVHRGTRLHTEILKRGFLDRCSYLVDAVIGMYAKCGALVEAQKLHDGLPIQDVFSWTALITGYTQQGQYHNALKCFDWMQSEGHSPDAVTFSSILKACGSIGAANKGEQIHEEIDKRGLLADNIILVTSLVDMYAKCGALANAQRVLEARPTHDVVSWSALISGYAQQGQGEKALACFEKMQREGISPNSVTFTSVLKACGSIGVADKGEQIHDEIARRGLLDKDIAVGNALVDMYAKCGALQKARRVLEGLHLQDVVAWNALIAGYTLHGQGDEALAIFSHMQEEGCAPDSVTFISVLKACGSIGAVDRGEQIHDDISRQGLLETNPLLGSALVDMYAKCGALEKAHWVLEKLPVGNFVTWSALIAGYVQRGHGEDALKCYQQMLQKGHSPSAVTYSCILKACGLVEKLDIGEQIHEQIASKEGLMADNIVLGTALVDMYAKCGALAKAKLVLEQLPFRDTVAWNSLIAGYAQRGKADEALKCFEQMQDEGLSPDAATFTCALKACSYARAFEKGEQVHHKIAQQGLLGKDSELNTALVDMYATCGAYEKAQEVLQELPTRNVSSWNALIGKYAKNGHGEEALNSFELMQREGLNPDRATLLHILKACASIGAADKGEQILNEIVRQGLTENDIMLGTAVVDMYSKCGVLAKAAQFLSGLPVRNVITWNALIAGDIQEGQAAAAFKSFEQMQQEGISPDEVTFMCLLKACGSVGAAKKGEQLHDEMVRQGLPVDNPLLGTAVVDMYSKCGASSKAAQVLKQIPARDAISWNALIAGYAEQGQCAAATDCFRQLLLEGHSPDSGTLSCLLNAFGHSGLVEEGRMFLEIMRRGSCVKPELKHYNSMVDLLGHVGHLGETVGVIQKMPPFRCPEVWSTLLGACQRWGDVNIGKWAFEGCSASRLGGSPPQNSSVRKLEAANKGKVELLSYLLG